LSGCRQEANAWIRENQENFPHLSANDSYFINKKRTGLCAMIRVEVTNAFVVGQGTEFLVLLKSTEDSRVLPISVGQLEAQSIAIKLNNIDFPRPLTHDLFKSTLEMLNCTLVRIEICDLREDTFYARLVLDLRGVLYEVDSRPSDAIALALRFGAQVFVEEKVMDQAGVIFSEEEKDEKTGERLNAETVSTEPSAEAAEPSAREALQKKLELSIREERYEDAARIRDELKKFSSPN
jgi:uncharacterized protein